MELTADRFDPRPHANHSSAATVGRPCGGETDAVIGDFDAHRIVDFHSDDNRRRPSMFENVRQCLLNHPIHRKLDTGVERSVCVLSLVVDLHSCAPTTFDERVDVVEPRLGGSLLGAVLTVGPSIEHAEDATHLAERPASGFGNTRHRLSGPLWISTDQPLAGGGLYNHHTQRVRNHVMELMGDPSTLIDNRLTRFARPILFSAPSPFAK